MPFGVPVVWMDSNWDHPPLFVESADGAHFTDVDGIRYLDLSLGITASSLGHTQPAIVQAVANRMAGGIQFQLPTEDAVAVSEELARRWGLPKWQFQLTSTQAVTEAVRLARVATGREQVLVFDGHYHGHYAELLAVEGADGVEPEYLGVTPRDVERTLVVPWNDLSAVERALGGGEVAALIAEPVLSNEGIVFPQKELHSELRRLTASHETLLVIDETQTLPMAYGGLVREWRLAADMVVLGKSIGGGIPVSALGMTESVATWIEREQTAYEVVGEAVDQVAIGGTMFGNALSMAALRAALFDVWTEETHSYMRRLTAQLAEGMRAAVARHGLDWDVYELGNRAGYRPAAESPTNAADVARLDNIALRNTQRVFMANRGFWEFGWWGAQAISAQTAAEDLDEYLDAFDTFLTELTR